MRPRRIVAGIILITVVLALVGPSSAAQVSGITDERPLGTAERVLIFTLPTVTWSDLERADAPNLERLLSDSVVGDLSVRSVSRRTSAADGYATLNAGTRTEGSLQASLAFVAGLRMGTDGDPSAVPPEAFDAEADDEVVDAGPVPAPEPTEDPTAPLVDPPEAGERYDGSPAAEEFARRTGVEPRRGEVFNFGIVPMLELNASLLFDAEVGALGDALEEGDVRRAVIANGDHGEGDDDIDFRREASVGLMDRRGLVEQGRVGRTLLTPDSTAPFGTRLDIDEVGDAFDEFWTQRSVVLVEASDLVRLEDALPLMVRAQQEVQRDEAIRRSDELLGRLLESVDLERDAVVVAAPYASGESTDITVVGVHAPSTTAGLISSGTTRRIGFVQTVDLAPTVLSLMDLDRPSSMEGTVMERAAGGGDHEDRVTFLIGAADGAKFRDSLLGAASVAFVVAQLAAWAIAIWSLSRPARPVLRTFSELVPLVVLAYLPATFIAGAIPFHEYGAGAWWAFVVGLAAVVASTAYFLTRRVLVDPVMVVLGFLVAFLSVDIVMGGPLQFNTVFGYTPTVAGRFNGMGNPAFSMLTAAAIILAALIAHRVPGRRGVVAAIALLVWCVILDGAPFLGADVGGALTLVPAAGVTAAMLMGRRIRLRAIALWGGITVAVVLAFGFLDLTRPEAKRTHLGRLLADIGDNGLSAFQTVVLRKLNANLSVLTSSVWILMLPVVFAAVAFVFWWAPWRLRTIRERIPQVPAALAGLITALVLGFALNDSGISVPGMMLGVANAALVHLLLRVDSEDGGEAGGPRSGQDEEAEESAQPEGSQDALT